MLEPPRIPCRKLAPELSGWNGTVARRGGSQRKHQPVYLLWQAIGRKAVPAQFSLERTGLLPWPLRVYDAVCNMCLCNMEPVAP